MIDVSSLRNTIATLLADELGTYTFSNALSTPALFVDDGSNPLVEQPDVIGLECIIQPEVSIAFTPMLAGDRRLDYTTQIILKQWDITKTTQAAREILISNLEIESVGPVVPRSDRLNNIETFTITVSDSFYLMRSAVNG